jgi:regulator of protease activity HflC (stomatin/prohibitin superfamily)
MRGLGFTIGSVIVVGVLIAIVLIGFPTYNVYSKQMAGKAAYEEAVQNRRIRVLEAQAALDSAKLTASAEIERAKGTNEANRIMAQSLGGPENYLRWSYINMLQETAGKGDRQVIYLPTEAGMPILEAGRGQTAR